MKSKELNKLNSKTIDKFINFIRDNREKLNVYFFIGSGLLKYINKKKFKSWQEIASQHFDNLKINEFTDLIMLNSTSKYIKEIEKNNCEDIKIEEENKYLRNIWNTLSIFFQKTNKISNKLKIITTNQCNITAKYFNLNNQEYYLNNIDQFSEGNYNILKIHNIDYKKYIFNIETYFEFFNTQNFAKLFNFFKEKIDNSNVFIIFGSSYSELHIPILFKNLSTIENSNNCIVWIRELPKEWKEENINDIKKLLKSYEKQNHLILFWKEIIDENYLLNSIDKKLNNLFKNSVSFIEKEQYKSVNGLKIDFYDYNKIVDKYKNSKNKVNVLNKYLKNKDFVSIQAIILYSRNDEEIKWYISKIKFLNNTLLDINWFLSLGRIYDEFYKYSNELINQCIKDNIKKEIIKNNNILFWIQNSKINRNNHQWIIGVSWEIFERIETSNDWNNRFLKKLEMENHSNWKKCEQYIINSVMGIIEKSNLNIPLLFFYLFRTEKLLKRKLNIIETLFNIKNINIFDLVNKLNLINLYYSYNKQIFDVVMHHLENYFLSNINEMKNITQIFNKNNAINYYLIFKENKELCKYKKIIKNKFKDIDFEQIIRKPSVDDLSSIEDIKFKKYNEEIVDNISKKDIKKTIQAIINISKLEFKKMIMTTSIDVYHMFSFILNSFIFDLDKSSKQNKKDINKLFIETHKLILIYKEVRKNNFYDRYNLYDKRYENLTLEKTIEIAIYLKDKNFDWFLNTFIHYFLFNGKINPTFDFYRYNNKNFSFIKLFSELYKKIDFVNIIENKEITKLYIKMIEEDINNFDDETIFIKIIYDVYIKKTISIEDVDLNLVNDGFFDFLLKVKEKNEIYYDLYFLYLSIIKKKEIEKVLKIYFSDKHINFYSSSKDLMTFMDYLIFILNFNKKVLKNNIKKDKIRTIINEFLNKNFNNKKLLIFCYEDIDKILDNAKAISIFFSNKISMQKNEFDFFKEKLDLYLNFYTKECDISIFNILISILLIYKFDLEIPGNDLWKNLSYSLNNINLSKDSKKDIKEKIYKFIEENKKENN